MNAIQKTAKIITKIVEIFLWIGAGLMAVVTVCSLAAPRWLGSLISMETLPAEGSISIYGFESVVVTPAGEVNYAVLCLVALTGVFLLALGALMFHLLHAIIKSSESGSPFQAANIGRLKWIGIFSIAGPIVSLVMSVVIRLALGYESAEISIDLGGFTMGLLVLCLTQYFIYGAKLEKDVDGLL